MMMMMMMMVMVMVVMMMMMMMMMQRPKRLPVDALTRNCLPTLYRTRHLYHDGRQQPG